MDDMPSDPVYNPRNPSIPQSTKNKSDEDDMSHYRNTNYPLLSEDERIQEEEDMSIPNSTLDTSNTLQPRHRLDLLRDYAAEKILYYIQHGLFGCSDQKHCFELAKYYETTLGPYSSLLVTCQPPTFPLSFPSTIGLGMPIPPVNQGTSRCIFPPEAALSEVFTGTTKAQSTPYSVCLHTKEPPEVVPQTSFDINSMIAFPTSLAILKGPLHYCPTIQINRLLRSDIHLERTIHYKDSDQKLHQRTLPLRDIPHQYIGEIQGIRGCSVYIFFPGLWSPEYKWKSLTSEQMKRFTDNIVWKSINAHVPSNSIQHLPGGYKIGQRNAKARGAEMRTGPHDSKYSSNSTYILQPEYLGLIWTSMLQLAS
jgi:hypothetical protein